MRYALVVLLALAVTLACASFAEAKPIGVVAALTKDKPAKDPPVGARGADLPKQVDSNIIGLEGWALFGKDAGAAAAITMKRKVGQWGKIDFHAGGLLGIMDPGAGTDAPFIGGVIDASASNIGGLALIPRWDGGFRLNFGVNVTVWGLQY